MKPLWDKVAKRMFDILKGNGYTLTLFDDAGQKVLEPEKARRFFIEPIKMMLSLYDRGQESEVKLYLSELADAKQLAPLIKALRFSASHFNLNFTVRKYNKELEPKMFAFMATEPKESMENSSTPLNEKVYWTGTTKSSYQKIGETRLIVRHDAVVNPEIQGSRSRRIKNLFIETRNGERFLFPQCHLLGARAMARHLSNGGAFQDNIGQHIIRLSEEFVGLRAVKRYSARLELNEDVTAIKDSVTGRMDEIASSLTRFYGPKSYTQIVETIKEKLDEQEVDLSEQISKVAGMLQLNEGDDLYKHLKWVAKMNLEEGERGRKRPSSPEEIEKMRQYRIQKRLDREAKVSAPSAMAAPEPEIPVDPKAKGVANLLDRVYTYTSAGETPEVNPNEYLEQARRIITNSVELTGTPSGEKPKPGSDPKESRWANIAWALREISQRINAKDDAILGNILSRTADQIEKKLSGENMEFGLKNADLEKVVGWALKKFQPKLHESRGGVLSPVRELMEWYEKFDPTSVFEVKLSAEMDRSKHRCKMCDADLAGSKETLCRKCKEEVEKGKAKKESIEQFSYDLVTNKNSPEVIKELASKYTSEQIKETLDHIRSVWIKEVSETIESALENKSEDAKEKVVDEETKETETVEEGKPTGAAFRDYTSRGLENISPREIAIKKSLDLIHKGRSPEEASHITGLPLPVLKAEMNRLGMHDKGDKYAAMAKRHGLGV